MNRFAFASRAWLSAVLGWLWCHPVEVLAPPTWRGAFRCLPPPYEGELSAGEPGGIDGMDQAPALAELRHQESMIRAYAAALGISLDAVEVAPHAVARGD